MQEAQKRHSAQLRYLLHRYYPIVLQLFSKLHQPLTYDFIEAFPGPEFARAASLDDLRAFFRKQYYTCMDRVPKFYQLIQSETISAHLLEGYIIHTQALISILRSLYAQLKVLEKQLHRAFHQHPDAQWWLQFPGLGELNGARLLARVGDNRATISSPKILRALAGTVPITRHSGKKRSVEFRQACIRPLRKAFYDFALHSRRQSVWAKEYYEQQRARGHAATRANRALANRWAGIIWKLWQTHGIYDEAIHIANQQKQKQRQAA